MNQTDLTRLPYRKGVGMMLLNADGQVFVGQRGDTSVEAWQMPQGGIDGDETPRDAALRELAEETGSDKAVFIAESADWYRYDLPVDLVGRVWSGRYRGQMQKWFVMRFTGSDSDINIDTDHPEFVAWQWMPMAELPDNIVTFKRPLYEALIREFGHLASPD
ncbi:MAG: RNA pyrophosphohydrolase [Sphingomonadales bacterium]